MNTTDCWRDMVWLDTTYNERLRNLVNEEWICHFDPAFKTTHNAICIMMDRVDDSAEWLNRHSDVPKDAATFLLFLVYGDIVVKTVRNVVGKLNLNNPYGNKESPAARQFLSNCCADGCFHNPISSPPDDETIWSYLRALAFAHTEKTADKRYYGSFLEEGEIQYSPFPKVDKYRKEVGVIMYSSQSDYTKALMLPYESLKLFVSSRLELVKGIVRLAENRINERKRAHMHEVIDESGGPVETLRILRNKYAERFDSSYAYNFDFALMCLTCQTSFRENDEKVMEFRMVLVNAIPVVVKAFKRLDYDECFRLLDDVCCHTLQGISNSASYQLQKVFTHLRRGDDKYEWAKQCAADLALDFPAKYVKIDVDTMSDDEVQLLITVASYFYRQDHPRKEDEKSEIDSSLLLQPIPESEIKLAKELIQNQTLLDGNRGCPLAVDTHQHHVEESVSIPN